MLRFPKLKLTTLLIAASLCGCTVPQGGNHNWVLPETASIEGMIETYIDPANPVCKEERCTFHLHYFIGDKFVKSRPTILFIPGGPGYVVNPQRRDLVFLEDNFNVIYFDIRGSRRSQIPTPNNYDKYLRARYVAEDIENLRAHLGIESWDAIYAHSFGTVVAQLYANKYGQKDEPNGSGLGDNLQSQQPVRVKKLILSAPLSRYINRENKRREERISNLESIFQHYRQNCACAENKAVPETSSVLNSENTESVNDFCFLSSNQIETIRQRLIDIMERLEDEYGSHRMVSEHYKELGETDFAISYPFPQTFFRSLEILDSYNGYNAQKDDDKDEVAKNFNKKQFAGALVLAYYASSNYQKLQDMMRSCQPYDTECRALLRDQLEKIRVPGTRGFSNYFDGLDSPVNPECSSHRAVHDLLPVALNILTIQTSDSELSLRAYYVFGFYDGMSGWLARANGAKFGEGQAIPCINAGAIGNVAQSAPNPVVKKHLKRIGVVANEDICPWKPDEHKSRVPTMILRGEADPLTTGGQADDVFDNGLTGDRVLIEFKEKGHVMMLSIKELGRLVALVEAFISNKSLDGSFCTNVAFLEAKVRLSRANTNNQEVCQMLAQDR